MVVGQEHTIDLMLTSLIVGGHILLEGVPGTAKTLMTQAFAAGLSLGFGRIQFTPDLMPGDILGTNLFDFRTNTFALTKGPIFADLLLADEINRSPPKTQAALLQAMSERAVTIDGSTHALDDSFMVIATQNPVEHHGTYPLPEAQLDRFLFKIVVDYPDRDEEREIIRRHGHRTTLPAMAEHDLRPVASGVQLTAIRKGVAEIRLAEDLVDYIVDIVRATRAHTAIETGASTRAATMLAAAARAHAVIRGRDFVLPDDVKRLVPVVLCHRIAITARGEAEGLTPERVLTQILDQESAPR